MALLETTSGPLQQGIQKTKATLAATAPYPGPAAPPLVVEKYFCESGNAGVLEFQ